MIYTYIATGLLGAGLTLATIALFFWQPFKTVALHAYRRSKINDEDKLNALFITKSGKVKETICDVEGDQTIRYKEDKYAINPNLQFMHHGVPTQVYIEGQTEPLDIADEGQNKFTTKELNAVMIGSEASELISLLQRIAPYMKYLTYGTLGFMAVILWISFQNMQTLSEITGQAVTEILKPQ